MGKYLKLFSSQNEYDSFISSDEFVLPNVSYIVENDAVSFHPYVMVYKSQYLTFETIEDSTFKLTQNACQYSLDEGGTWVSLAAGTNTPTVPAGSKIMFKCTNPTISNSYPNYGIGTFSSSGKFNVEGNIMSMLYGDDFIEQTDLTGKDYAFRYLFSGCTNVVEAHNLMLPATTLAYSCYSSMFYICKSLTTAPELPATTLSDSCYHSMFNGCTGLTTAPSILPATTLAETCYYNMFNNCTSLTTVPELLATNLARDCYGYMFRNCSSLNNIIMLATDISASACLTYWVDGVASTGTFVKHSNMTSLPTGINGIPKGWEVKEHITPTECTSLTITADDVIGNDTTTTIHYTATYNGVDYKGSTVTGIVEEGTAVSAEFPQNTSETETVDHTITFEFMGITSSTVITQGVWINKPYTVDLNNQWELSTTITNPNSTVYEGVYQSFSNKGVNNSAALMYIDISGCTSFKFYVRSYAESNYDFVVVSNLDSTLTSGITGGTNVKLTTKGKQNSGTGIDSYQLVEFTGIDGGEHRITVMYRKDSGSASGDDRGYVLIPKNQ